MYQSSEFIDSLVNYRADKLAVSRLHGNRAGYWRDVVSQSNRGKYRESNNQDQGGSEEGGGFRKSRNGEP
jgi:hypothetical protein